MYFVPPPQKKMYFVLICSDTFALGSLRISISLPSKEYFPLFLLFDQDTFIQIRNMPAQIEADKRPYIGNYFKQILKQNSCTSHTQKECIVCVIPMLGSIPTKDFI